ncbi:MAG: FAD-dependent oxidoreductase [Gammaproteobacteria bacterium]|nr:FAD-dependent oxidoreductase [Gammaproteobacteria bacterium]
MQPVPQRCDVVVVGAGYAGLSAALTLARAGRNVHVFDRMRPGEGASTRNGGIASGALRPSFASLIEKLGVDRARTIYLEAKVAREDLADFITREGIKCDYQLVGRFTGASYQRDFDGLRIDAELHQKHFGINTELVTPGNIQREIGTDRYFGGVVRPDIAGLHPAKLHAGMLALARQAGATVHGETAVTRLQSNGNGFDLRTLRGPIRARHVVVATNGYGDRSNRWLRKRLVPVASRIIATEAITGALMDELIPQRRMLGETRNLYHYFRPSPDGSRILFGGRCPNPRSNPLAGTDSLRRELVQLFPRLSAAGISHSWFGYVAYNRDSLPRLFVHDGVHYAAGFCGSGVVWARWLGLKAALHILGDPQAQSAFHERAPKAVPLYNGNPWFLPMVTGWLRFKDGLAERGSKRI